MQRLALLAAVLVLVTVTPHAAADHIDTGEFQKGCGFTEDQWDEGVYDCGGSIPSIQDPGFVNASQADGWLEDGDIVIGVAENGTAKAYPIKILNWHEIVNDEIEPSPPGDGESARPQDGQIGSEPIAVTYCPLCGSSIVFERTVGDRVLDFHVSGYLFRQDLVMVDEQTHTLWPQIEASAARGPLHGTDLALFPSTTTGWADWKELHPDTLVLERPRCDDQSTENQRGCSGGSFQRNYETFPYGSYDSNRNVGISGGSREDVRGLHPKDTVLGLTVDGTSKAYPFSNLSTEKVVNDEVGSTPVVITWFSSDGQAFERSANRTFTWVGNGTIEDDQGNRYDAVTGASQGAAPDLEELGTVDLFWFAWLDHNPDTQLYTTNGTVTVGEHEPPGNTIPGAGVFHALAVLALASLALAVTRRSGRA